MTIYLYAFSIFFREIHREIICKHKKVNRDWTSVGDTVADTEGINSEFSHGEILKSACAILPSSKFEIMSLEPDS